MSTPGANLQGGVTASHIQHMGGKRECRERFSECRQVNFVRQNFVTGCFRTFVTLTRVHITH